MTMPVCVLRRWNFWKYVSSWVCQILLIIGLERRDFFGVAIRGLYVFTDEDARSCWV